VLPMTFSDRQPGKREYSRNALPRPILKGPAPSPGSGVGIAALVAFLLFWLPGVSEGRGVRGLWVVRDTITSAGQVRKCVDFAAENGFNVLFVQVRGRGDAFYNSYFVPPPEEYPEIPDSFDPLGEIISQAHEKGIEVHAWFNMYLTWSKDTSPLHPEHPLNLHPEWFMVSVTGRSMADSPIDSVRNEESEGRFLSPCLEEVREYLSRVVTEVMVTYDVDGVHLDYVRYPGRDYDFHPRARRDFIEAYGVDPVRLVAGNGDVDPALIYLGKWVQYRAGWIDEQVGSIRRRMNLVDPNIRLSAAVKAHADEALFRFGQNWAGWLNDGVVDFVVTMSYFPDTGQLYGVMSDNLEVVDPRKVVGGVGVYKTTPEAAMEQISLMRGMNLLGFCLFSYTSFLENPRFVRSMSELFMEKERGLPPDFRPYVRRAHE